MPIDDDDEMRYNRHNFNEGEQRGCMKLIQFTKRKNVGTYRAMIAFSPSKSYIHEICAGHLTKYALFQLKECYFIGRNSFVVVPGWEKKTSDRDLVGFVFEERQYQYFRKFLHDAIK